MKSDLIESNSKYISHDNNIGELKISYLIDYISRICEKIGKSDLDIERLATNVFIKLKLINTIEEIENQIVSTSSEMVYYHYDFSCIAIFILISNLHEKTSNDFLQVTETLFNNFNDNNLHIPIVSNEYLEFVRLHYKEINDAIRYERDYSVSVFGFRTLEKSYLKRTVKGRIVERPQHLYMRVAIALHMNSNSMNKIIETYELLSLGYFIHATPTLYNAGTLYQQLSSCFLLGIEDDMAAIGECWKNCAILSKNAGGIGINMNNIRTQGSYIRSTHGKSSGLRVLTVFDSIAHYADQGGKRPGSIAVYIEPWHGDIFFFLNLRKNTGAENERTRNLFLGLFINDIFMERVENNEIWSLMCPVQCPNLLNKYGDEFTKTYLNYESEKKFIKQIPARELWFRIMESQIETGTPYILFKDHINRKSNHMNIGVINGSNLCVAGNTQILTDTGYHRIDSLKNKKISVWNGQEFSETIVVKTGINQELMLISFSNGTELKCTSYHKFYVERENMVEVVEAENLRLNDILIDVKYPVIEGTLNDIFDAYEEALNSNEFIVPFDYKLNIRLNWFAGFLDRFFFTKDNSGVILHYADEYLLTQIKYMLQTMGCNPFVYSNSENYSMKLYYQDIECLFNLGMTCKSIDRTCIRPNIKPTIRVVRKRILKERENTYCFSEPKRHMGIFNGIITGQCAEIVEFHNSDEYAVCFTENTEVITREGIRRIVDCDNTKVLSMFDSDNLLKKYQHYCNSKLIYNGFKPVYRLETLGNKPIEATENHPFLVWSKMEYVWKKLKDIRIGDKIITPDIRTIPEFKISRNNFDTEFVKMGYFSLKKSLKNEIDNFSILVKRILYTETPINQASFLCGLFSINGYFEELMSLTINMLSTDRNILYNIQSMLIPFGIRSIVGSDGKFNYLEIKHYKHLDNFMKFIGFELEIMNSTLKNYLDKFRNRKIKYPFYSRVTYISFIGMREVYDLSVKKSHNFIANGHVVHNCNLSTICLPKYVKQNNDTIEFDYSKLYDVTRIITRNLDNVIDINFYPVENARISNMKNRPIGIGVQGLADLFYILRLPFDSEEARSINKKIFETIYFAALTESNELAKERGCYSRYEGSPLSRGQFQFNLWGLCDSKLSGMWDWDSLRKSIIQYGIRNSLVTTCPPTASTSQIAGNNESIEPYTENIYTRDTGAGEFYVINKYLMKDLMNLNLWNDDMINLIKYFKGSIAKIPTIPDNIKKIYRTAWEIPQKSIIEMAADRGPFVDQTQSMNIFIDKPNFVKLTSCLFYGWKLGLKTGIYYLRSKAGSEANQFGIDIIRIKELLKELNITEIEETEKICKYIPKHLRKSITCDSCSS